MYEILPCILAEEHHVVSLANHQEGNLGFRQAAQAFLNPHLIDRGLKESDLMFPNRVQLTLRDTIAIEYDGRRRIPHFLTELLDGRLCHVFEVAESFGPRALDGGERDILRGVRVMRPD